MFVLSHPIGCSKSCDLWPTFAPGNTWSLVGTAMCRAGGNSQILVLPSLTPLSIAICGRLQLGAPHWATLVALLSEVDKLTPHSVVVDGRHLAIEDFTFLHSFIVKLQRKLLLCCVLE